MTTIASPSSSPSSSAAASSRATYLPTSYLASLPPTAEISMSALVAEQDRLADEAREAMPYAFDECSWGKGYLRQNVYSCLDCGGKGVCYGCSISCHSDHTLVELWSRRHFRCDCPTIDIAPPPRQSTETNGRPAKRQRCTLNPPTIQPALPNEENRYSRNFRGEFCRCGRRYDPLEETEGMLCCIACEDWFHESCLNLRSSTATTRCKPTPEAEEPGLPSTAYPQPDIAARAIQSAPGTTALSGQPGAGAEVTGVGAQRSIESRAGSGPGGVDVADEDDDDDEDDDEKGIILPSKSYDCLVCAQCVKGSPILTIKSGGNGWMMVEPDMHGEMRVVGREIDEKAAPSSDTRTQENVREDVVKVDASEGVTNDVLSRKRTLDNDQPDRQDRGAKREKLETGDASTNFRPAWRGKGDVFLAHGVRERLKTELTASEIAALPFPLEDDELYEPPKDDEKEETLDEVTARVVGNLPRVQAIEALHGYQRLKDRLQIMLASHAQSGAVVGRDEILAMFAELREGSR